MSTQYNYTANNTNTGILTPDFCCENACSYTLFGEVITEYNSYWHNGLVPDYMFNAKELDEESGVYYYSARYYAPPTFISRDPLFEVRPYMSPYAYCSNSPINRIDPSGMLDDEWDFDPQANTLTWVSNKGGNTTQYITGGYTAQFDNTSTETVVTVANIVGVTVDGAQSASSSTSAKGFQWGGINWVHQGGAGKDSKTTTNDVPTEEMPFSSFFTRFQEFIDIVKSTPPEPKGTISGTPIKGGNKRISVPYYSSSDSANKRNEFDNDPNMVGVTSNTKEELQERKQSSR